MKSLLLLLLLTAPVAAKPATWDALKPPRNAQEAASLSRALNESYLARVQASHGPQWWVDEETQHARANLAHCSQAAPTHPPGLTAFVDAYADEQLRLARLFDRVPSEVRVLPGETAGWEQPDDTFVLSFDDGPSPQYTEKILATLRRYNTGALFFLVGKNVHGHVPDYDGFVLGEHTQTHAFLPDLKEGAMQTEIEQPLQEFAAVHLPRPRLFRAPYGARGTRELQELQKNHLRSVLWNVDSQDWQKDMQTAPGRIARRTLALMLLRRHGIVLMHDVQPHTPAELQQLLPWLQAAGLHTRKEL